MMFRSYNFFQISLIILSVIPILDCSPNRDKSTSILSEYLEKKFNIQIPEKIHYYILVPKSGCQGAIFNTLSIIDAASLKQLDDISIVTSNKQAVSDYLHGKWQILYDTTEELDVLNLPVTNVSLIKTQGGSVKIIKTSRECESDVGTQIVNLLNSKE